MEDVNLSDWRVGGRGQHQQQHQALSLHLGEHKLVLNAASHLEHSVECLVTNAFSRSTAGAPCRSRRDAS